MYALCSQIVGEKDPAKFLHLVTELSQLLDGKEQRLGTGDNSKQQESSSQPQK